MKNVHSEASVLVAVICSVISIIRLNIRTKRPLGEMYMLDVYLFQQTALTSLKGRQLRIFSDAVSDDRFNATHEYPTAEGFPQTILNVAVDRWSTQVSLHGSGIVIFGCTTLLAKKRGERLRD